MFKENNYLIVQSMEQFTPATILKVIRAHKANQVVRLKKLYNYYRGKNQAILNRTFNDKNKPNVKISNNFCRLISDQISSMFIGKPVKYSSEDSQALLELQIVNEMNKEEHHNAILAKNASIYGQAFEVMYMDANSEIRFSVLPTEEVIPIYSAGLEYDEIIGAIRYYTIESLDDATDDLDIIEVYDHEKVTTYHNVGGALKFVDLVPHYFGACPINVYQSNDECIGDFETVISLIDAFDAGLSDTANLFQYFSDAYLVLSNAMDSSPEEFSQMAHDRVLLLPEGGTAEFLTKQIDSTSLDSYMNRLKDSIFAFSYAIDLSSDNAFGNDTSGTALRYRMMMLENICANRQALFSQAIECRNEKIFRILGIKGKHLNASDIKQIYTINIPSNLAEQATMAQQLTGIVSKETILEMLSVVEDVQGELERINGEQMGMEALVNPYPEPEVEDDDDLDEVPPME